MNFILPESSCIAFHPMKGRFFIPLVPGLIMLFMAVSASGQSSFTWYFGTQAGIRFSTNGSTMTALGSNMTAGEGCTVTSDTSGVILFYSDGIRVWDNSSATPVSTALLGNQSATQAALAIALPGSDCHRFLVFTTAGVEFPPHDLGVALVNVTGTAPAYAVSVSEPALPVVPPSGSVVFGEKLAATSDTSGGYWVVAHDYAEGPGTATTFYKYHITSAVFASVTTTAQAQAALLSVQQTQSIGSNHHDPAPPNFNAQGQMKFSKNGQKLALVLAGSRTVDLFSFDLTTGLLSVIATTNVSPSNGNLYGCELSPDGSKLYASEGFAGAGTAIRKIYQWDISGGALVNPYTVASGSNIYGNRYKYNALQLGPNDKIYCSEEMGISFLSVIENPNSAGAACGWSSMTVPIAGTNMLGLATVMSNFGCSCLPSPGPITGAATACRGDAGRIFSIAAVPGATGYSWSLPPGVIIQSGANTSMITVAFTAAATSGSFSVHAYNASCNSVNSPSFPVTVSDAPAVDLGPDQDVCEGQTVTFDAGACAGCSYLWSNLSTGQLNIGTGQTYTTGTAGIYAVSVVNAGNCADGDTVLLSVGIALPVSVTIAASANPVCAGTPVTFTATAVNGGTDPQFQWKVNAGNANNASNATYTYVPVDGDAVTCEVTSNATCAAGNPALSDPVTMTVKPMLPVSVTIAASANPVCAGIPVTFTATPVNGGTNPQFQWKVNAGNANNASNATYTYVPTDGDEVTCEVTSNATCAAGNPATSNFILLGALPVPLVSFSPCFDTITTVSGKPFRLKGGLPLNGVYSGPGVSAGFFNPSAAGAGPATITYSYTNASACSNQATVTIVTSQASPFTCGEALTDPRDNKTYPTVQIGSQCWMAANLDFGTTIDKSLYQTDNCIPEKYAPLPQTGKGNFHSLAGEATGVGSAYQWHELMRYESAPGSQGLCPPGWHVPAAGEWEVLAAGFLGPGVSGKYLQDPVLTGFEAMPSGMLYQNSLWSFTGEATMFWTSTPAGTNRSAARGMHVLNYSVSLYSAPCHQAMPVRCLWDGMK